GLAREGGQDAARWGLVTSAGAGQHRLRGALMVAEVAVSIVLLVGAGLMMKSTLRLLSVNPGFATDRLITAQIALTGMRYSKAQELLSFYGRLFPAIESLPGVRGVATVSGLPLTGGFNTGTLR